jgi:type IV secretory pathway component VirB8
MKKATATSRHTELTVISGPREEGGEAELEPYHGQALSWETSRVEQLERSERRAWGVAGASVVVVLLSWLAIVFMLPLKEAVPYVIRVDNATGVPDIVTTLKEKSVSGDEVMDKYWVARYVRARETYDWVSLQEEYESVNLLSAPPVAAEYNKLFEGAEALDKKLGSAVRVTTSILSIVLSGHGVATVRFVKHTRLLAEGREDLSQWVATIGYEYKTTSKIRESLRLTNPFGFQALTYRVDPEEVTPPTSPTPKEATP